jgi:hypothetical protein
VTLHPAILTTLLLAPFISKIYDTLAAPMTSALVDFPYSIAISYLTS